MSSARARHRRRPVAHKKLRRHAQPGPRAAAASVFFFLLCYELFVLRAPPEPSRPPPATAPTHRAASPVAAPPPPPPPPPRAPPPAALSPSPRQNASPHAAPAPATASSPATTLKSAVSSAATPQIPAKASPALLPPRPISHAAALNATSPTFQPLKKKHSHHTKHSTVASSLLDLEKQAADTGDDTDTKPAKKRHSTPSSAKPHRSSKSDHGAHPGSDENFWQWFQDTKGKENEGTTSIECPVDNQRVCLMYYKYLRKYKIRTTFDVSCARNLDWMPLVLKRAGDELWGFKYYCSLPDGDQLDVAKQKFQGMSYVEFVTDLWWRTGFKDDTELLFAWDTLPHLAYGRIWSFFVKAKSQDIKYILFDNYPGIMNDPSPKRHYLNIRKHPFRFPAAKEVVQNVTEPGETEKRQLLFYESSMLPQDLQ